MLTPDADDGPVMVTLTYRVHEPNAAAFTDAMRHVGRSRRRTGALRWELFRDGGDPTRFVESYLVGTWAEHLRQHTHRLTGADRRFEEQALQYAAGPPEVAHLFPPPASDPAKRVTLLKGRSPSAAPEVSDSTMDRRAGHDRSDGTSRRASTAPQPCEHHLTALPARGS
jgi:quinol monooxygenase YgiN